MENVWLYTRLSRTLGDPDDPSLMQAHLATLTRLAAQDGVTIPPGRIYTEVGSGDSIAARPVFSRLLQEWQRLPERAGGLLYLVETSRLSRGTNEERGRILDALIRADITIRTPERRLQPSQPQDEFLIGLTQMIDRDENNRYRQRLRIKWDEMTRQGIIVTGGAPFGYRWDKNLRNLVAVEPAFSTVGLLFRDAIDLSCRQLATRYGLRQPLVSQILRNPVYSGWPHRHCKSHRYGPHQVKGTKRLPRDEWLKAEQPGTYPAAVTLDLWEAVQVALDTRLRTRAKCGFTDGWCRDVLRFIDEQGLVYLASHLESKSGQKEKHLVYALLRVGLPRLYVSRELVHRAALAAMEAALRQPALLRCALADERERQEQAKALFQQEASPAALSARLNRLRREADDLLAREIRAADAEQRASIARVWEGTCREIEILKRSLAASQRPAIPNADLDWLTGQAEDLGQAFSECWSEYTEADRRRTVNAFVENIDVLIEPVPGQRAFRREVVAVGYRPWLESFMSERASI